MKTLLRFTALASTLALAAPTSADDAGARQHFRRGVELYDKKQYAEALEAFSAAYADKPSAIIKQNVALSYKGMGRNVEAAAALDEALEEGKATLSPEAREAIERELAELARTVATLELLVVAASDKRPIDDAVVTIDGAELPKGALRRPIRLAPGIHVVTARVAGYADPPEKRLGLVAGSPVDATFEMGAAIGSVTLRADVPTATIKLDGAIVGQGSWSGRLTTGAHRVEVSAPGYRTTVTEVVVTSGVTIDYPISLARHGEMPPPYVLTGVPAPKKPKPWYVALMGAFHGENLRLAPALGEKEGGERRDFKGGALGVRGGRRVSRFFALELHLEGASISDAHKIHPGDATEAKTEATLWQITPVVRFSTVGSVRFTTGSGIGLHGISLESSFTDRTAGPMRRTGSTLTASWMLDFGAQFDVSPLFLEGVVFFDVHGVGMLDDATQQRLVLASPAGRVGLRLGVAMPF